MCFIPDSLNQQQPVTTLHDNTHSHPDQRGGHQSQHTAQRGHHSQYTDHRGQYTDPRGHDTHPQRGRPPQDQRDLHPPVSTLSSIS